MRYATLPLSRKKIGYLPPIFIMLRHHQMRCDFRHKHKFYMILCMPMFRQAIPNVSENKGNMRRDKAAAPTIFQGVGIFLIISIKALPHKKARAGRARSVADGVFVTARKCGARTPKHHAYVSVSPKRGALKSLGKNAKKEMRIGRRSVPNMSCQ